MRMWMVDTDLLCRKHLFGEHVETHMILGSLKKQKSLAGFKERGLIELDKLKIRHDELANEILKRGFSHKSPLDLCGHSLYIYGKVDVENNLKELKKRCPDCRKRILEQGK